MISRMAPAAAFWALAHEFAGQHSAAVQRAGIAGEGPELGEALFDAMLSSPSGLVISREEWADVWQRVGGSGHRINLDNPELIVYKVVPNRVSYMQEWALEYHDVPLQDG